MRLRTTVSATAATALLAAVLALPAPAMAATPANPAAGASPAGAAIDPATSTATAPSITQISMVKTDSGTALKVETGTDDPATALSVAISTTGATPTPVKTVTAFTQVSAGVWQSDALHLGSHGWFSLSADATDAAGTHLATPVTGNWQYDVSPVFHDLTAAPAELSYGHESVTVSGHLTTYDPDLGVTSQPFAYANMGFDGAAFWSAADGSFTETHYPNHPPAGTWSSTVDASGSDGQNTTSSPVSWTVSGKQQTRMTLDRTSASGLTVGGLYQVTGHVEFQDTDGTWKPLASYPVQLGSSDFNPPASANTDANGHFVLQAAVPQAAATVGVYLPDTYAADVYLVPSSATFQITSVQQQVALTLQNQSIDAFSALTFDFIVNSTNNKLPGGKVYVLESANGSTGWKNLGYIPVSSLGYHSGIKAYVDNPHAYWRLWYPGATGYSASLSNVIHTYRGGTLITGGRPNTTSAHRGQTLTFGGRLFVQGTTGPWTAVHAGYRVVLVFRPSGSKTWYYVTQASTRSGGYFTLRARATRAGTWAVVYLDTNGKLVDSSGPMVYVGVH